MEINMFYFRYLYYIPIIIGGLLLNQAQANRYQEIIQNVSKILVCNQEEAKIFMHHVNNTVKEVQNIFSDLASHSVSENQKQKKMQKTLKEHFEKPTSSIQVSSLYANKIKTYPVNQYLIHLAELSKARYAQVKLYYKPDYLSMGKIYPFHHPVYGSSFEFRIGVWQIFEGRNIDNRPLYIDATQKDFIFLFHKMSDSKYWTLKIKSIYAKETVTLTEFEKIWK